MGFEYSGKNEETCKSILQRITDNTEVLKLSTEDINVWNVVGVKKGSLVFYSYYPSDVLDERNVLESGKFFRDDFRISIPKEKFIKYFHQDAYDNLMEVGFMFRFCDEAGQFQYLIPTPDFMSTYTKFLGASGSLLKKSDLFKDLFLIRELYEHEFLHVIGRRMTSQVWDMYSVVTGRYSLVPQIDAFHAIEKARDKFPTLTFLDYRITDSHSYINYTFGQEADYLPGVQILLSDIGDASTTVTSFVRFGSMNVYSKKVTFAHSRKVTVEDLEAAIQECCDNSLDIISKLKKVFNKKVAEPEKYFTYIFEKSNLKKAYGSGIADSACEQIYKSFKNKKKTTWSKRDIWVQLVRIMNYPKEDITFSTMESVRKATGKAFDLIMKDA